jgi:tellurite methyltransferase
MSEDIKQMWDEKYRESHEAQGIAVEVLQENLHLLPRQGRALELACGLGANALLLSAHGLEAHAWDISAVAIERLNTLAHKRGLHIHTKVHDVLLHPPEPASFDVIVVSYFLDRALIPHIVAALRANGLLFYQTFTRTRVSDAGPQNEDFRLANNEFLDLFAGMHIVLFREEGRIGDLEHGLRDEAYIIAQKKSGLIA